MSSTDVKASSPPEGGPPSLRSLRPIEFVEEFATTKQRCAVLQRLFAYRKRLLDANPLWFTQLVTGPLLDPTSEPERATVHSIFVGAKGSPEEWRRGFPDIFVSASIRSRFGLEGEVIVATEPSEIFRGARALALNAPDAVEVPLLTAKDEGAARAMLEARRHDVRKGRAARKSEVSQPPVAPQPGPADAGSTVAAPAPGDATSAPPRELEAPVAGPLIAYDIGAKLPIRLRPASNERDWIEASPGRYAARCLPLLIANQSGWEVVLDGELTATWNGRPDIHAVTIDSPTRHVASSHFGLGILTFHLPFIFRTPPGYNLLVRGPSNRPRAGISPLEGVVETDWTSASFTMNWQITEAGRPIRFVSGDVIAMIVPQRRGELELFEPRVVPLLEDPEMASRHEIFVQSRFGFLKDLKAPESIAKEEGWQRHYFQGRDPDGTVAPEHQTKLKLKPFA
jgi:hypothetical protein